MMSAGLKTLLTALALLVPTVGAAGYVTVGGLMDSEAGGEDPVASDTFQGQVLESWTGDVPEDVTAGTLDLRAFTGAVYVATWDAPSYEVTVLVPEEADGERLGDGDVDARFSEDVTAGTLDLALEVRQTGTVDVGVNQAARQDLAVVAFVPDLAWTEVVACTGGASPLEGAFTEVARLISNASRGDGCLEDVQDQPLVTGNARLDWEGDRDGLDVPFRLDGLAGESARAFTQHGSVGAVNVSFDALTLATQHGDVTVANATVGTLEATTQHGPVSVQRVVVDEAALATQHGNVDVADVSGGTVAATTQHGNVDADTVNVRALDARSQHGNVRLTTAVTGAAEATLATQHGNVDVKVPAGGDRAYAVDAATQHGDVRVDIPGVRGSSDESDDGKDAPTVEGLLAADGDRDEDRRYEGRTPGYGSYANRLALTLSTQHGNVRATAE